MPLTPAQRHAHMWRIHSSALIELARLVPDDLKRSLADFLEANIAFHDDQPDPPKLDPDKKKKRKG